MDEVSTTPSGGLWTPGANMQVNVPLGLLTSAALVALRPGAVMVDEERLLWRLCFMACSPTVEDSVAEAAAMAAASVVNKWPKEGKPLPLSSDAVLHTPQIPSSQEGLDTQGGGTGTPSAPAEPKTEAAGEGKGGYKVWSLQEVVELVVDHKILPCITDGLPRGAATSGAAADVSGASADVSGAVAEGGGDRVLARVRAVRALSWVLKGLAMRGHPRAEEVAEVLLTLLLAGSAAGTQHRHTGALNSADGTSSAHHSRTVTQGSGSTADGDSSRGRDSDEGRDTGSGKGLESLESMVSAMPIEVAQSAARGLGVVMDESEACLNAACHAFVRPLFRQRLLTFLVPGVFAQAFESQPGSIARYTPALSSPSLGLSSN